jgi:hypothetical protein
MDKAVSVLISLGIITFGGLVIAAAIVKGWVFAWAVLALFALIVGFVSLFGSGHWRLAFLCRNPAVDADAPLTCPVGLG